MGYIGVLPADGADSDLARNGRNVQPSFIFQNFRRRSARRAGHDVSAIIGGRSRTAGLRARAKPPWAKTRMAHGGARLRQTCGKSGRPRNTFLQLGDDPYKMTNLASASGQQLKRDALLGSCACGCGNSGTAWTLRGCGSGRLNFPRAEFAVRRSCLPRG